MEDWSRPNNVSWLAFAAHKIVLICITWKQTGMASSNEYKFLIWCLHCFSHLRHTLRQCYRPWFLLFLSSSAILVVGYSQRPQQVRQALSSYGEKCELALRPCTGPHINQNTFSAKINWRTPLLLWVAYNFWLIIRPHSLLSLAAFPSS